MQASVDGFCFHLVQPEEGKFESSFCGRLLMKTSLPKSRSLYVGAPQEPILHSWWRRGFASDLIGKLAWCCRFTGLPLAVLFISSLSLRGAVFPEGFENGWGNWAVEGGVWQIGNSSGAHSGGGLAGTILNGDYPNNADARLISPEFAVPAMGERPRLRFWSWHRTYNANDYGQLQVRTNGGTWVNLTEPLADGTGGTWMQRLVDLSAYGGQTVQIGSHFVSNNDLWTDVGWYVDDRDWAVDH